MKCLDICMIKVLITFLIIKIKNKSKTRAVSMWQRAARQQDPDRHANVFQIRCEEFSAVSCELTLTNAPGFEQGRS